MYVLRRLLLTTSAVALFSAYTIVSVAVRKIKTYFASKNSAQEPYLLQDIQHEILNHILEEFKEPPYYATRYQLFELGTVCKDWFKFISHHDIWNRFIEQVILRSNRLEDLGDKDNQISDPIQRLLGTKGVFSPRIMYYLFEARISKAYHGQRPRPTLVKITPDLKPIKNNNTKLWTPWLNHSILKTPEIVWKWLYTSIRYPKWAFALIFDAYDETKKYSIYLYPNTLGYMKKILKFLSIGLSLLPWVDNVIWNSRDVIRQVIIGKYYGLWMKAPWTLTAQIQTVSFLLWMQLFNNLFFYPGLVTVRGILLLLTLLFMRGLFPFLLSAASVGIGVVLLLIAARKKIFSKIGYIGATLFVLTVLSPLMYFYPGLFVLESAALSAVVLDMTPQGRANLDHKIKIFLALAIGTIGWAAVV